MLRLFVKTLTADDMYSVINRTNLTQPIQMQLSQKYKTFLIFFCIFQMFIMFRTFLKKDDPHILCISENTGSEKRG